LKDYKPAAGGSPLAHGSELPEDFNMMISSDELLNMVFRRTPRNDTGEFSMDSRMLTLLMEIDGKTSLGEIARKRGLQLNNLQNALSRLLQLKLITPVQPAVSSLDQDFLNFLRLQLSQAVGPIAEILIEDAISDLGHSLSNFPANQVAELVDLLSREIQREDKAMIFKQNIVSKIRQKGY
jgi:hypothetical protein